MHSKNRPIFEMFTLLGHLQQLAPYGVVRFYVHLDGQTSGLSCSSNSRPGQALPNVEDAAKALSNSSAASVGGIVPF